MPLKNTEKPIVNFNTHQELVRKLESAGYELAHTGKRRALLNELPPAFVVKSKRVLGSKWGYYKAVAGFIVLKTF